MKMFSDIDAADCEDNHASSKDGEDYAQCSSEIPIDNGDLQEISFVREVLDTLDFGEDRKDVSYIQFSLNSTSFLKDMSQKTFLLNLGKSVSKLPLQYIYIYIYIEKKLLIGPPPWW